MLRAVLAIFCLLCCFGPPAQAGDPATEAREVVRTHGYDGIWSMDCLRSPSERIPRINWVVPDHGPVQQWVDVGHGYYLEGIVAGASVTPDDRRFTVSVRSLSGGSWVRTTMRVGEKIRLMELTDTWRGRSAISIKNGHDLRTDQETPTVERCGEHGALTS